MIDDCRLSIEKAWCSSPRYQLSVISYQLLVLGTDT